jgi:hydroxypyruvate isomerase
MLNARPGVTVPARDAIESGGGMPRLSANLSFLFTERPFLDRFAAAAKAGFQAVEYMSPYEHKPADIACRLADHGLTQALFNLPVGDWSAGERGLAILPGREKEFRDGLERALEYAEALGCERLNCLAGIAPTDIDRGALEAVFLDNLAHSAETAKRRRVKLLIEPINNRDIPGFYLNHTDEALRLMDGVKSDNLYLQADIYHMQVMEGDLARRLEAAAPRIAHIQIADNPGRHEPGTGEINFRFLFSLIDRLEYEGWVGCEYRPVSTTEAGLVWIEGRFHRAEGGSC